MPTSAEKQRFAMKQQRRASAAGRAAPQERDSNGFPLVNRYSAVREIACRQIKGANYGQVYVDHAGSIIRSHEISDDTPEVFISPSVAYEDRMRQPSTYNYQYDRQDPVEAMG